MIQNNKKAAVIYQGEYPPTGGLTAGCRRLRDITRGIACAGFDTELIAPSHFPRTETIADTDYRICYLGTETQKASFRDRMHFWSEVQRYVLQTQPTFALFYMPTVDSVPTMRRLRGKSVTVGVEMCDMRSSFQKSTLRRWYYKLDEYFLPKSTNFNVIISSGFEDHVQRLAPNTPSLIVPPLVDFQSFTTDVAGGQAMRARYSIPLDAPLLMYAGGLWKHEGVGDFLVAFRDYCADKGMSQTLPHLIIAGRYSRGEDFDDVETMVKEFGLEKNVHLPGWLRTEDIVALYSTSDIAILPQRNEAFSIAAMPTKLAEYCAMGKAIIATDVGDISKYLTDGVNAVLCKPDGVHHLKSGIERCLESAELRRSLGHQARCTAEQHFDYRNVGSAIEKLLQGQTEKNAVSS